MKNRSIPWWTIIVTIIVALVLAGCAQPTELATMEPTTPPEQPVTTEAQPSVDPRCIHPRTGEPVSGQIVWAYAGGVVQETYEKCWFKTFQDLCGVEVITVAPSHYGQVQEMVKAGAVEWDIYSQNLLNEYTDGIEEGLWRKMEPWIFDGYNMAEGSVREYGTWTGPYTTAIMWNKDKWPDGGEQPTTPMDFFDVEKFPGRRCVGKYLQDALEIAWVAAGHTSYPIDVDEALAKLATMKDDIVWWETGQEPITNLENGECDIAHAWNGRAAAAVANGGNFGVSMEGLFLRQAWDMFVVNSPNPDATDVFMRYIHSPEIHACYPSNVYYAGGNLDAMKLLPPEVQNALANSEANLAVELGPTDVDWWIANTESAQRAFDEWLVTVGQ